MGRVEAILLRGGLWGRALLQDSFVLPQWVGVGEPGLGSAHHLASCFFQLHPTPSYPMAPWEAPKPSFPIEVPFLQQGVSMSPSGSQAPSLPPGTLCGPHVSLSTSAFSLVLSQGDWEDSESATCWASQDAQHGRMGKGWGSRAALLRSRQDMPQRGCRPSRTTQVKKRKLKHPPG